MQQHWTWVTGDSQTQKILIWGRFNRETPAITFHTWLQWSGTSFIAALEIPLEVAFSTFFSLANRLYLEDGFGAFFVVCLGLLYSWDEGQFLQVLQDGEGSALLWQLLAVAFTLGAELADCDAGQEAFHVRGAALLQHLQFWGEGWTGCKLRSLLCQWN